MASEDMLSRAREYLRHVPFDDEYARLITALAAEVRELRKDRELLVKLHAAWTYPHAGSIGALLDEVAERVEPGIFGDAAMAAERGEGEVK